MKPVRIVLLVLFVIALAAAIVCAVRFGNGRGGNVAKRSGDTPPESRSQTTDVRRQDNVRLSAKTVETGVFVATRKIGEAGSGRSKLLLARNPFCPVPETEEEAGTILWIDDSTGEIVCGPDETWSPMPDGRLIDLALSGFGEDEKNYYKVQPSTVEQAPGVAVVTFLVSEAERKTREGWLIPPFLLRVWVDTRSGSTIAVESGQ